MNHPFTSDLCYYRRSLYGQIFEMRKPLVKTFEGVYIEVEPEGDLCWKKCLSSLYHAHHVHPAVAKQMKLSPERFKGRKIVVSLQVSLELELAKNLQTISKLHQIPQ